MPWQLVKGYQVLLVGINDENEFFFRWMEWSTSTPIEFCFVLRKNLICFRSFLGTIIRQKVKHQRPDGWKTSRKVIIEGKKIESSLNMEIITEKMFSDFSRNAKLKIFFFCWVCCCILKMTAEIIFRLVMNILLLNKSK